MADETPAAVTPAAPPAVESAPVAAAAEAAVVTSAEGAASTPSIETPAPAVETLPAAEVTRTETPSEPTKPLLGPEAVKPEEAKADDATKPDGEAPKSEPATLPVYEFKLPEGAKADNPQFKAFQTKLGEFQNLSKAEQAAVQKFGQDMIDMHMADVQEIVKSQNQSAWDWFNNRNKEWLQSAKKDPVIGGDNFDTTVNSASQAISLYGGTKSQQIETAKLLQETGLENSPIMLRFLSNITKIAAKEGAPVSGSNAPSKQTFNPAQAFFGGAKSA